MVFVYEIICIFQALNDTSTKLIFTKLVAYILVKYAFVYLCTVKANGKSYNHKSCKWKCFEKGK